MPSQIRTWKPTFTANTIVASTQDQVKVFHLANGDFWVAWRDFDNSPGPGSPAGSDILGQRYNALGEAQGANVRLNTVNFLDNERNADFAVNGNEFFVAYEDFAIAGSGFAQLRLERKGADGSQIGSTTIALDPTGDSSGINIGEPRIAIASATNGLIVWERRNGSATELIARFFNPSTGLMVGSEAVLPNATAAANLGDLIVLANGNYVVAWNDASANTGADVQGLILNQSGGTVGSFARAFSSLNSSDPSLAALTGGKFVLAVTELIVATGQSIITLQTFTATGATDGGDTISETGRVLNEAVVAATHDGGFVVAWEDDTAGRIIAHTRASNGGQVGSASTISSTLSASPMALVALADGRVLLGTSNGDVSATILDPRAAGDLPVAYAPVSRQVGTILGDVLEVASGVDVVNGWDGDDVLTDGTGTNSLLSGDEGNDTIIMESISSGEAADGGNGTDTLEVFAVGQALTVDLIGGTAATNSATMSATNFERFTGSSLSVRTIVAGTNDANRLQTGSGNDVLNGRGGSDTLIGGAGNDEYLVDELGDEVIEIALEGADRIFSIGSYVLRPGVHVEMLTTNDNFGTAAIGLTGNEMAQAIFGNEGANILSGGGGLDDLIGFGGDDLLFVDSADDRIYEATGGGFDRVLTSASYTLAAGVHVELFTTTDNFGLTFLNLTGNEFDQAIFGNNGSNVLTGGGGLDDLIGFGGDDFYHVDSANDRVVEATGGGFDRVFASVSYTLAPGVQVEQFTTTDNFGLNPINLRGNELDQAIFGNDGANTIDGGGGTDDLVGFGGDDRYTVDSAADRVSEASGGGFDTVFANVDYTLAAGVQVERLQSNRAGGADVRTLVGNELNNQIIGDNGPNVLIGGGGTDSLTGNGGDDRFFVDGAGDVIGEADGGGFDRVLASATYTLNSGAHVEQLTTTDNAGTAPINLTGNFFDQAIFGNDGPNLLSGGGGTDDLIGFGGNDNYAVDSAGDRVVEGQNGGSDTVFSIVSYTLGAGVHVEFLRTNLIAGSDPLNLTGNELDQNITGNQGSNILIGGGGTDVLVGEGGDDFIFVDSPFDQVFEFADRGFDRVLTSATYTLGSNAQVELFTTTDNGGVAAIDLTGNQFDQTIFGNEGANILDGRAGADSLVGLGGNDTYQFSTFLGGTNVDLIYGFVSGADRVVLSAAIFTALPRAPLAASAFVVGTAAQDADDRIIFDPATGNLFYDEDGAGGLLAVQFATVMGGAPITAADIVVL